MINIKKHIDMLGMRVEDRVSGFKGVVSSVSFDLYGCVQGLVHPGTDKDGKIMEQCWFDLNRLKVLDKHPVMGLPNFEYGPQAEGRQGAAKKPMFCKV